MNQKNIFPIRAMAARRRSSFIIASFYTAAILLFNGSSNEARRTIRLGLSQIPDQYWDLLNSTSEQPKYDEDPEPLPAIPQVQLSEKTSLNNNRTLFYFTYARTYEKAEAELRSPNSSLGSEVKAKFLLHSNNKINGVLRVSGVVCGMCPDKVCPKVVLQIREFGDLRHHCQQMGSEWIPLKPSTTHSRIFKPFSPLEKPIRSLRSRIPYSLTGTWSVMGRGLALVEESSGKLLACGVIRVASRPKSLLKCKDI